MKKSIHIPLVAILLIISAFTCFAQQKIAIHVLLKGKVKDEQGN